MTAADPESLVERSRGRCLDKFLLASVVFLFLAVFGAAAGAAVFLQNLKSSEERIADLPTPSSRRALPGEPYYKKIAYVHADTGKISNQSMKWRSVRSAGGNPVGTLFTFNQITGVISPTVEGMFYLYVDLVLTCTANCKSGSVTVTFMNKNDVVLDCRIDIPDTFDTQVQKCWNITTLSSHSQLHASMKVDTEQSDWKLDENRSGFGIFLIDQLNR
ncbi:uncharacterized protein [Lepisosteus oculatus]|uniref:uncharacterized protein n=1 Tax=Lepisosteus oculatus TaxID=7918 RepID=UPI0007402FDD|nr:PREDICTED: uncharacterized protein LOC107077555 [Lepisosteus oculatus]